MNQKEPLISVIVPVYNTAKYLQKCVDSILSQTYHNLELILVDDGSTDESGALCDDYASKDCRVKVIHKKNGGLSSAREEGISAVAGQYAVIVDSDDWIDNNVLEECIKIAIDSSSDVVMFPYIREYENNSFVVPLFSKTHIWQRKEYQNIYRRLFGPIGDEIKEPERIYSTVSCCMKLYSTNIIKKGRFFDTKIVGSSEDALFNIYALNSVNTAAYTDSCYYHYRKISGTTTGSYRIDLWKKIGVLNSVLNNAVAELKLDDTFSEAVKNRFALSTIGIGLNEMLNPVPANRKNNLKQFLSTHEYVNAISQLDFSKLTAKWKIFFSCCKYQCIHMLMVLLRVMAFLKNKK